MHHTLSPDVEMSTLPADQNAINVVSIVAYLESAPIQSILHIYVCARVVEWSSDQSWLC